MSTVLGPKIKNLRTIKGITQDEMAKQLNINRTSLSNWEIGRADPDLETLIMLADFFNVTVDLLLFPDDSFKNIVDATKREQYLIGERIKQRRLFRNLSQPDFARILSKTVETLIELENNNTPTGNIPYEFANLLAVCLQAPLPWLMGMSESPWFVPPLPETVYFGHALVKTKPNFDIASISEKEIEFFNLAYQTFAALPAKQRKKRIELTKAALKFAEEIEINQNINNIDNE
jgi:transcriptional regulator with XRE-family HTH domain